MTGTASLKDLVLGDIEHELKSTRKILERVPEEKLTWKPHDKSMTLGGLATHVANLPFWGDGIASQDEIDLATLPPPMQPVKNREELLRLFDERVANMQNALAGLNDETLGHTWTLRRGDYVISQSPKAVALRQWCFSHIVHHRGQLSVYLRLAGTPVPGMYGPSADER
jgi:uncharacterized damage-inducible protein DinB